ncbi:MAG: hypothetical protein WBA41_06780 [Rivularia sp. (in: cyanobacteria)]
MTQKPLSKKLVGELLQSIDPKQIADEGVRQTVELLLNLVEQRADENQTIRRRKSKTTG